MMASKKSAIVTGAGSGVGRATALGLAEQGFGLVLAGRTKAKLEQTRDLAAEYQDTLSCCLVTADLTDPEQCHHLIEQSIEHYGRIDALANVAGVAPHLPIKQITPPVWRRCIDTNLSAIVYLTAAAWPVFERQESAVVVNVSSIASLDPFPGFGIYAAAKVGLNMFTSMTAKEGAGIGLSAVTIAPGAVETPMLRAIFDKQTIAQNQTLDPIEVGQVICGCITGERSFESGQVIVLPSPGGSES